MTPALVSLVAALMLVVAAAAATFSVLAAVLPHVFRAPTPAPASAAEPAVLLTLYYRGKPTVTARCATRREAAKRWIRWHAALSGSGVSWNVTSTTL